MPIVTIKPGQGGLETSNVEAVLDDGDLDPFVIGYPESVVLTP